MHSLRYILPKEVQKLIPIEYYDYSGIHPYDIPIFGLLFWKRIKFALKLIHAIQCKQNLKFKNVLDIGCGIGLFSLNLG